MQPLRHSGTLAAAHMLRASDALQGFYLVNGNFSVLGVSNAYSPAVASQPNVVTNSLGLPASISVSRLGVLLNTGQTFQVRGRPSDVCIADVPWVSSMYAVCQWRPVCWSSAGLWAVPTREMHVYMDVYNTVTRLSHIIHALVSDA